MEVVDIFPLDQLVQLPGTFEDPVYYSDCIAVAAEECSGSFSQGSLSPETFVSATDDPNLDLLDDFPNLNEEFVKEIVNDLVYEDPSFGSVLVDSDISDIFNDCDEPEGCNLFPEESKESVPIPQLVQDAPTRRKQRIVPMVLQPFETTTCYAKSNTLENVTCVTRTTIRKRSLDFESNVKSPPAKFIRVTPTSFVSSIKNQETQSQNFLKPKGISFVGKQDLDVKSLEINDSEKLNSNSQHRMRGLTQDERKERKKLSNRNASYRYRQKKKEETDSFFNASAQILEEFEKEKEAYQSIVEEFLRCIKHAQLVSHARGKL